ncbi:hybrid sensor histidine kinase/response regulator [Hyphomicrobium sp.]|uniref:hybrid sensor histidine kinase/response regulator n=1 Tax=Hyphomicrobium sp. TaxID=82 RepID=UPI0025B8697B|nr:hybrid sensor histidine kinase/response regulator [Hyphomicrobium sp.]MCC7250731.1 hybrid sensor histidine kinase/response regulator [Hyphomicrobium sp.]
MTGDSRPEPLTYHDVIEELQRRNQKLAKINSALMQRVERSMDYQANAYSMFQTAIGLETQVRVRTEELKAALNRLERTNEQLTSARDGAERANRFKTGFFTAVSHDLLQPLHAARLSLSALGEIRDDTQHRRLIGQVDHALSTIEELLRTILDLSKLESGALRPTLQIVEILDLFRSVLVDIEPIAREKGLELSMRARDVAVTSDPLMLRRILQNLLANAVQYTETGRVLLAARKRGSQLRIDVWDTGPGIARSEQTKIFEEFQRGAAGQRSHASGFGVGLAIIARMSEALGHRIELCSEVGRGTRFSVFVAFAGDAPSVRALRNGPRAPASRAYGLSAIKAIVIDNDGSVRDAMRALLDRWGCEARLLAGLADVEALVTSEPEFRPEIILADFHLDAGESGLTAVARLREAAGAAIPTVVITADHSREVSEAVAAAGCEILRKPVKPAELRALITHLVG